MKTIKDDDKPDDGSNRGSGNGLFTVLAVLAWAIVPAAIFSGLVAITYSGSGSSSLNLLVLLFLIFPAGCIYEAIGLGTFSLWNAAMPGPMWLIVGTLAYVYGLVLVLVIRGLWRLIRGGKANLTEA